jgi:tetratricopeptide (TPR) repeat protein
MLNKDYSLICRKSEDVLILKRTLAKKDPLHYRPQLAMFLNEVSGFYLSTRQNNLAIQRSLEALEIYTELSKYNPEIYQSYKAKTLSDLSAIYLINNNIELARKTSNESIYEYEKLEKKHLMTEIDAITYASTILASFTHFEENKSTLNKAKNILMKYPTSEQAKHLLRQIEQEINPSPHWITSTNCVHK